MYQMRTPIQVGDEVYCADFDERQRSGCWVNGSKVLSIDTDAHTAVTDATEPGFDPNTGAPIQVRCAWRETAGGELRVTPYTHRVEFLRHRDEPPLSIQEAAYFAESKKQS